MAGETRSGRAWRDSEGAASLAPEAQPGPEEASCPQDPQERPRERKEGRPGGQWHPDVRPLVSSERWLRLHGLRRNKLTLSQIVSQLGFPRREGFIRSLGRRVASRYAVGLFHQYATPEGGKVYNLTAKEELLHQCGESLTRAAELLRQRLEWLTSESRQIFGVIQETSVAVVLDLGSLAGPRLALCQEAVVLVLREQVAHLAGFNVIRAGKVVAKWQEAAVPVDEASVGSAVAWIRSLEAGPVLDPSRSAEAVQESWRDPEIEAIYYLVAGDLPQETKQELLRMISKSPCPVHPVSFNATEEGTIGILKELSSLTRGRFHAFAERTAQLDLPESTSKASESERSCSRRKLKGRSPPGAGVREDVFLVWRELEEARYTLSQVQALLTAFSAPARDATSGTTADQRATEPVEEECMSSLEWLQKYGLKAQKLTFYDALVDCTFRHADGVVDIKVKPEDPSVRTDALTHKKIVHAKYCERFVHVPWKDGSLVHVYITAEKCKAYEERMGLALEHIDRRMKWLQRGSRAVFGTVLEDHVCLLIDTSRSMKDKLALVKEKIFQLMQEQLRHKRKFNFVKFDGRAEAWQDRLAEVNERNLRQARSWVRALEVGSSTNTLRALQIAVADGDVQAIYLLSDGRPDQPPETILAQARLLPPIPIHTIAFCCSDPEASAFLHALSRETGGRPHFWSPGPWEAGVGPEFSSEDLDLLQREMEQGRRDLQKVQDLYAEGLMLDGWFNGEKDGEDRHHKRDLAVPSAPGSPHPWASAAAEPREASPQNPGGAGRALPVGPNPGGRKKKALHAEETKTSLLRAQFRGTKGRGDCPTVKASSGGRNPASHETNTAADGLAGKEVAGTPEEPLDSSSARWLRIHGLEARRLTLTAALAPTAIPHRAKYVPVLDKHVVSKVFDELFPVAHVSGDTKQVTLVNPQAVDLRGYRREVLRVVRSCQRRLNLIVWKALSQEERDRFDGEGTVTYLDNREAFLEALERLDWPLPREDVTLLEDEIEAGAAYLRQALDLQEAAGKDQLRDRNRGQKHPTGPEKRRPARKADALRGQRVIARSEASGFYFPGTAILRPSATRALVTFRHGETEMVPTAGLIPVGGAMPGPLLQVGDFVLARSGTSRGQDRFVPAIVILVPAGGADPFYTVLKYDNEKEDCLRRALVKISQAKFVASCSYIREAQARKGTA
ncbi:von Willebrand factor A domain-containing protein 3B isoform X3 [Ornithorhynchus anatinus]|uniref:von Willebrand factor A domain-containing protein 3B isoform X3 n=1 Tax=Ornithorhynchus anatinus TaxID=9258 RepID=UPI0019D451F4|nr:von Willebrand factor A domain-containing protein 3B isoform X3 [Ornithorhynchus anatinus]